MLSGLHTALSPGPCQAAPQVPGAAAVSEHADNFFRLSPLAAGLQRLPDAACAALSKVGVGSRCGDSHVLVIAPRGTAGSVKQALGAFQCTCRSADLEQRVPVFGCGGAVGRAH